MGLPLPQRVGVPVQAALWLAAATTLAPRVCGRWLAPPEGHVFAQLHAIGAAFAGSACPVPPAVHGGGGGGGTAAQQQCAMAAAGGACPAVGSRECRVVVHLVLCWVGFVLPVAYGHVFERSLRRRFEKSAGATATVGRGPGPGAAAAVPPGGGRRPRTAAAVVFGAAAALLLSWLAANALAGMAP